MVRRQPSGLPLAEAIALGPGSFGVRPPILAEWADPAVPAHSQTAYLRRDVDDRLEQVIAAVTSDGSRIAVLVGALGVGKTRACWEAVHRLPPDWRVWCPGTAEGLLGGVQRQGRRRPAASLRPRTVLWLDRLERYLDPQDTEVAAHVVRFLAALLDNAAVTPVLVLGTLPSSVDRWLLTSSRGRDPGPVALCRKISDLLRGSEYPVLATLSPEETDAAQHAALSDPRWRTALDLAPQRPIPYLAGVTSILDRYERATLAVKAVLTAAGDARRAGAPRGLPSGFLEEAAVGYLPPQTPADDGDSTPQQRPSAKAREAVRAALVLAMVERAGIPGPLRAIPTRTGAGEGPEPVIVLAGCLEQHLRASRPTEQPKDSLWAAALTGFAQPTVLATLARAAEDRGRYGPAARLYERAWALGDLDAGVRLAALRDRAGDIAGAEQAAGQVADVEGPQAWMALAHRRAAVGDRSGADRALERAAAAGHGQALVLLARRRELSGDAEGAERAAAEAARVGHADAWMALGELRARAGHQAAAWHAFTQAGRSGNPNAWVPVARWEEQSGHTAGAEHACRMAAMAGLPSAWTGLATLREDAGDRAGADRAARAAAAWGDPRAWTALARSRKRAGDLPATADAFEQAARAGDVDGWTELARLHEQAGDQAAAEHAARRCAAAGSAHAWMQLAVMCEHADDPLTAARALAHGVRSRDGRAWTRFARSRERLGDAVTAQCAYEHAARQGHPGAWTEVARRREISGCPDQAEQAADLAEQGGDPSGWTTLAVIRERAGDSVGAEKAAERAAAAGSARVWVALGWLRARAGDRRGAMTAYREAADAGCPEAWVALTEFYAYRPAAEDLFRRAADQGSGVAWARLAQLREQLGDPAGADRAAQVAGDLGTDAWSDLARRRHRVGDRPGTELAASRAAALGEIGTLLALIHVDQEAGNWAAAARLARMAAAAGCPAACAVLATILRRTGQTAAAERLIRFGLTETGEPATQLS